MRLNAIGPRVIIKNALYGMLSIDPAKNPEKIIERIEPLKIVSFDVFDTLLKRNVRKPSDVFRLAQRIYESRFGNLGFCLCDARLRGEALAYEESGGREVSLSQIYSHITCDDVLRTRLIEAEIESEKLLAVSNEPVKKIYEQVLKMGKKIILVSDMYLDSEVIECLIKRAGYIGYSRLFVSSEIGRRKSDGSLFPYVCEQCDASFEEVIHIGDSIWGDYFCPKKVGMSSILIPRDSFRPRRCKESAFSSGDELSASIMSATIANLCGGVHYYRRFGIEVLGPLLLGLSKYVYEIKKKEKAEKVFFLARDGYVLKKAYDRLFPSERKSSAYLYASRRSIGIPSVYSLNDLLDIAPSARHIRASDFVDALGISGEAAQGILRDAGYHENSYVSKSRDAADPSFQRMLLECFNEMQHEVPRERATLRGYLNQERVKGQIILFDLGWAGNIQGFMQRFVREEIDPEFSPTGVFLGFDLSRIRDDIRFRSYLGNEHPTLFLGLIETCFSAPEGTVKSFQETSSGEYIARCADYEYDGRCEARAVAAIHVGALDLIDCLLRYTDLVDFDFSPDDLFEGFRKVGLHPSLEDVKAFADFCFEDNGIYFPIASPSEPRKYILRKNSIVHDFSKSKWKVAFLKRLVKLPLPYASILSLLKHIDASMKRRAR